MSKKSVNSGVFRLVSQGLLKKFRWICGGVFFLFAYAPLFTKTAFFPGSAAGFSKVRECCTLNGRFTFSAPMDTSTAFVIFFGSLFGEKAQFSKSLFLIDCCQLGGAVSTFYGSTVDEKVLDSSCLLPLRRERLLATSSPVIRLQDSVFSGTLAVIASFAEKAVRKVGKAIGDISMSFPGSRSVASRRSINVLGHKGAVFVDGRIKSNFYADTRLLEIPQRVVDSVVKNVSPRLNFKRSLKKGDRFEIVYKGGSLVYCRLTTKRGSVAVYKFKDGRKSSYFFEDGNRCDGSTATRESGEVFGAPLIGKLSVSDGYGWRVHPILKKSHFHSGVDFRAKGGTLVYAMQDGIVTRASYFGGYGNCIDLKHSSGYSSRYAHLSRMLVRPGTRVKKGQAIGRVGSTGYSTGFHLHLELARNDRTMNPFAVIGRPSLDRQKNTVENFSRFKSLVRKINFQVNLCKTKSKVQRANGLSK